MPRPPLATVALGVALLAAGCGARSDAEEVKDTVRAFRDATAAHDYTRICRDVLAPVLVARLDAIGLPCPVALSKYLGATHRPTLILRRVVVRGDTARAVVRTSAAGEPVTTDVIGLVRVRAGWRLRTLSGTG